MPEPPVVVAALAVLAVGVAAFRMHRLRRALDAERAARRLTAGMHARDMEAFQVRLEAAAGVRAVLTEADRILDTALAAHYPEGGPK